MNQKKKNGNAQRDISDDESSESEDSNQETIAENAMLPFSGVRSLGWSRVHLMPNGNVLKHAT